MQKSTKFKKFCKVLFSALSVVLILSLSICLVGFMTITADAQLDKTSLVLKSGAVNFYSLDGKKLLFSQEKITISTLHDYTTNAFIAKEDKRFWKHNGYDVIRMFGALKSNIKNGKIVEGGSTISQQLIKNTHTGADRTLNRKLTELKLATDLEKEYTKEEILELYLNTIYFGNGCYGLASASDYYFNKPASDLTLGESAMLAGLISAPSEFNPINNLSLNRKKAKIVLSLMCEQKYITEEQKTDAEAEVDAKEPSKNEEIGKKYLSFASREALSLLGLENFPSNKQIEIYTYMDEDMQRIAENELNSEATTKSKNGIMPDSAIIALDNTSGGILVYAGNSASDLLTLRRQPASCIKPILVYAPAIEKGIISPASLVLDEPINIDGYQPQNATKMNYGYVSVREAIEKSLNIPAVKILSETGVEYSKKFASLLGIKFNEQDNNLALALGGFTDGVTPLELATAYMTFGSNGNYKQSRFVKEIVIDGNSVYRNVPLEAKVVSDSTNYLITDILKTTATVGTARRLNVIGIHIAAKTGTNSVNGEQKDLWTVAYTTEHTYLGWIGATGGNDGGLHSSLTSSVTTTTMLKPIITECYRTGNPADFERPPTVTLENLDADTYYNDHKLLLADEQSTSQISELFCVNNLPERRQEEHNDDLATLFAQMNFVPYFRR